MSVCVRETCCTERQTDIQTDRQTDRERGGGGGEGWGGGRGDLGGPGQSKRKRVNGLGHQIKLKVKNALQPAQANSNAIPSYHASVLCQCG